MHQKFQQVPNQLIKSWRQQPWSFWKWRMDLATTLHVSTPWSQLSMSSHGRVLR